MNRTCIENLENGLVKLLILSDLKVIVSYQFIDDSINF